MATKKSAAASEIDPDRRYKLNINKSFEHDGVKYIPRAGTSYKVLGSVLLDIKDNVDSYEAI